MSAPAKREFLYELWDRNWDDGPLGNYKILRHEITRTTPRRIYFTFDIGGNGHVDRQKIESDGRFYHRPSGRLLFLAEPELPSRPQPVSLPELKRAMADAHPDRGGTDEAFIAARARYTRALAK